MNRVINRNYYENMKEQKNNNSVRGSLLAMARAIVLESYEYLPWFFGLFFQQPACRVIIEHSNTRGIYDITIN